MFSFIFHKPPILAYLSRISDQVLVVRRPILNSPNFDTKPKKTTQNDCKRSERTGMYANSSLFGSNPHSM